ncbi:MAG TPA: tyrosine-type recombinase/integrase [Acidimicrobiales bacterium]|nr:tyrosine-type recombinase/integrase [Acidimicrobiales bacterium]
MQVSVGELIDAADTVIVGFGNAPSTLWQYRWAWSQFEVFCSREGVGEVTEDVVPAFLLFMAAGQPDGQLKEWKRKLLRKSVLVLCEVAATGTYRWRVSRQSHPNDVLDGVFRPVQEDFERWMDRRYLATATKDLYATVSRTVLAWLPEHGVTRVEDVGFADVSAGLVFLGGHYRPQSMRTVACALRVLCRFLEELGCRAGLSDAVPTMFSRRVRSVQVLPAGGVDQLIDTADRATPAGRRNRAVLLLAARTGLRPVDIAGMRLADVDWRQARITIVQHKTGTVLSLPLLADVGEAIADYLLHARPAGGLDDHLFLRLQAPFTGLVADDFYHVAVQAFTRAGIAAPEGMGRGLRVLRASMATRMLEHEVPLAVISGSLGHRGTGSARHYLAADERRMRECCLDFVGIEPAVRS